MSDSGTNPAEQTEETTESPNVKQMRENMERQAAENAALRTKTLHASIRQLGLDPEKGPGALLVQTYKPESVDDLEFDKVKAFADQYNLTPSETPPPQPEGTPPPPQPQGQGQQPQTPPMPQTQVPGAPPAMDPSNSDSELDNEIVQAQQAGDWERAAQLHRQKYLNSLG